MLMWMNKNLRNRKGYTLTELIVVVVILGVLAMVAAPIGINLINSAKEKTDDASAKIMGDTVSRLELLGEIDLKTPDKDKINEAVKKELKDGKIPDLAQGSGHQFVLTFATGKVEVKKTSDTVTDSLQMVLK